MIKFQIKDFAFVCDGMINFNFLKKIKLKFYGFGYSEDHYFGVLLFTQTKNIYIYPKKNYVYRIRKLSSMNFTNKKWVIHSNCHLKRIDVFENSNIARLYYETISWMKIALEFINYNHQLNRDVKTHFLPVVCNKALTLQRFDKDLLCLQKYIKNLKIYIQNQPLGAVDRIKEYLSYKVAKEISNSNGVVLFLLPFKIICIVLKHQKEVKKYKQNIKKSFLNKRLPLEFYKDYQEALDLKNQKLIRLLHNIGFKIMSFKG